MVWSKSAHEHDTKRGTHKIFALLYYTQVATRRRDRRPPREIEVAMWKRLHPRRRDSMESLASSDDDSPGGRRGSRGSAGRRRSQSSMVDQEEQLTAAEKMKNRQGDAAAAAEPGKKSKNALHEE